MEREKTCRIRVFGIVQGVGFRPTVSRHAARHRVLGSVCNKGPYVEIYAQGAPEDVDSFCRDVRENPPERAVILKMAVKEMEEQGQSPEHFDCFSIVESKKKQGDIFVSPDIAICPKCKKEMYDPKDRRYLHPFINCTCCGPRLTILDAMPYDRERTSMKEFPMCEACAREYTHPETRRYDAQPVCCNECGPEVYILEGEERGADAIRRVRRVIRDGGIAGIKGIGGFHLCCDASNEKAVRLLRERKYRPVKPFAVMMRDLETVRRECELTGEAEEVLDGYQKPILLLPRKESGRLCEAVAPGNPKVGVMLPYAPVQLLLFDYRDDTEVSDCLVMTSANTSGAPICRSDEDARRELSGLCDIILSYNRKIRLRADDTVMDCYRGEPYMIRRSRGYAPLPVMTAADLQGEVLAVGGELKNTFCIGKNQLFYPSPYVGDMGDLRTVRALEESIARMEELLEVTPSVVACDLHPSYNTTAVAEQMAKKRGIALYPVQHHYAHILSCMAENDVSGPVLGVSFDGTGYGLDGTIWGGEFLLADYEEFRRMGSIDPFLHVGGDVASREGWRIAVSMLYDIYGEEQAEEIAEKLGLCDRKTAGIQIAMAKRNINSIVSTSAGRLFDAVSAILGVRTASTYEGEASVFLQFAAERAANRTNGASEPNQGMVWLREREPENEDQRIFTLRTSELVRELTEARLAGENPEMLAQRFHRKLAEAIVAGCCRMREQTAVNVVALSGGVYQNVLLLRYTREMLEECGFQVLTHHLIPPNDGGICLGQAAAAMRWLQKNGEEEETTEIRSKK